MSLRSSLAKKAQNFAMTQISGTVNDRLSSMINLDQNGGGLLGSVLGAVKNEIGNSLGNLLGFPKQGFHDGLVALAYKSGHPYASYPGIMAPLNKTKGMIFPYRPSITVNRGVQYNQLDITHALMGVQSFKSGGLMAIEVSGEFTAQSAEEAEYLQACIHFLRTSSLMGFGQDGAVSAGMPPPVLDLSFYGQNNATNVGVILNSCTTSYPNDVDYIRHNGNDVPTHMVLMVSMTAQMSPDQMRRFSLDAFAAGSMQNMI